MVIVLRSAQLLPLPVTHLRAGGLQKKACSYTVLYEYLGILIIIMLNCLLLNPHHRHINSALRAKIWHLKWWILGMNAVSFHIVPNIIL